MRNYKRSIALFIIIAGLLLFLFPFASIVNNELSLNGDIKSYEDMVANYSEEERNRINKEVEDYQTMIHNQKSRIKVSESEVEYERAFTVVDPFLDEDFKEAVPVTGFEEGDAYGYIVIPKLGENLPLYLGASNYHLSLGAAQITGSDLPVGGEGTRCVIAGHRGYYSRPMFRYVDVLTGGDRIYLYTPQGSLVYEVKDIEEIYPTQTNALLPREGKDTLTLLTCTPYPTNRMRLLINAERVDAVAPFMLTEEEESRNRVSSLINALVGENGETDPRAGNKKKQIYGVTIVGIVLLILAIIKFIKTLGEERRAAREAKHEN